MPKATNRIQLEVTSEQRDVCDLLMKTYDMRSASEVFRRALRIMEKIADLEHTQDVKFGFVDDESTFTEVWFI